jgi:hypothetical protein
MIKDEVRFFLNKDLNTRFRIICLKNDLKPNLQLAELVRHFVETQEYNEKFKTKLERKE